MPDNDAVSAAMGQVGRYQLTRFVAVLLVSVPGLCHIFLVVFSTIETDFWCDDGSVTNYAKSECAHNCSSYSFDKSFWTRTLISDYQLVCSRAPLLLMAKIVVFSGYAVGTVVAGFLSDFMGRKAAMSFFSQLLFGTGIIATVMPNIAGLVMIWFFVGVSAIAVYTVAFVWTMEMSFGKWKSILGFAFAFSWPTARLLVAGSAYLVPDWKFLFQLFSGVHLLTPLVLHFVCESPLWLISVGKASEAKNIIEDIAKANGRHDVCIDAKDLDAMPLEQRENFSIVFKTPILLKRTLILWFNWFTVSFIIYGLNLNWQALTGSVFLNFVVISVLDFPAKAVAIWINMRFGRRVPYITLLLTSGTMLFLILAFKKGDYPKNWPIALLAIIGAISISVGFSIVWMYTAELYPTGIRNAGVGAGSMLARIGGVCATTMSALAKVDDQLPPIMFGSAAFISVVLTSFLPETGGYPLPKDLTDIKAREEEDKRNGIWIQMKSLISKQK